MRKELEISDKEFNIIGHSLGVQLDKYIKDVVLPKEYYRNYFQAGKGHDDFNVLLELVGLGLMRQREQFGMPVFHVTDKGKKVFEIKFKLT